MGLAEDWSELSSQLPPDWGEARVGLRLDRAADAEAAAALLAPLSPLTTGEQSLTMRIARDGTGPGIGSLRSGLARLDSRRLRGRLTLIGARAEERQAPPPTTTLVEAWETALSALPADWSDLLAEVELDSSDYLERGAVNLAPVNPRRTGEMTTLRFRSARSFGYGASPGMVRTCLARCDRDAIRGRVRILRALSDTRPVATQGPVWQLDGETV